ncbi:TetR/AcrR family transcriptional regulator [Herbidospora mongoliensis]|uniref:TetR/AcrR family transcriptional regulator n=1 Tax=Herbidospora mongoliensis TaxID=688067 RepID=UPI001C3F269A|nr:TetR family transcriptional regulator [Herbidospora mongoliensis]
MDFQRARKPEQVEARRAAILGVAREMLRDRPLADISLNELSATVGLAKSNVLRYFGSREVIFLEVLDETWRDWLDRLTLDPGAEGPGYVREERIASQIADAMVADPRLCELVAAMASVLERNMPLDYAREFKRRASANTDRFATMVGAVLPHLSRAASSHFAGAVFVITAGLWPYATPSDTVAQVSREMGIPPAAEMFAAGLREGLTNLIIGLSVRAQT